MTDIFISYSRKDVEMVSTLARTLEEMGYSVWWDVSGLHGGQAFAEVIQEELSKAKCAIVIWSEHSVKSKWVQSEANFADSRDVLLTAMYRDAQAPMPFNTRHNENLRGWSGNIYDDGFQKLLKAVDRICPVKSGKFQQTGVDIEVASANLNIADTASKSGAVSSRKPWRTKKLLMSALALAIAVSGIFYYSKTLPTEAQLTKQDVTQAGKISADLDEKPTSNKIYKLVDNLSLLPIPAGSFMMGSNSGSDREKPVHHVTFAKPFWMSKTEITFDQYDAYVAATGARKPGDEGWGRGSRPVINVSQKSAQGYAKWFSENNGQGLQCGLPSEAEWEYAARAGSSTEYSWGDLASHEQANYGRDTCCGGLAKGRDESVNTAPVGSFPANAWGLQDMHGNVWEWVQDTYHSNYNGAPSNGKAWETSGELRRLMRGGSWSNMSKFLRSSARTPSNIPYSSGDTIGFRVVCSPSQ